MNRPLCRRPLALAPVLATIVGVTSMVSVTGPTPTLSVLRFMAFGDSLTEGIVTTTSPPFQVRTSVTQGYPRALQTLLRSRYKSQNVVVTNEGKGGERAEHGVRRFEEALATDRPDVVLLMEGANDVASGESGIPIAAAALADMIRMAHEARVHVMLATIPPQRPGAVRAWAAALIPPLNEEIRKVASLEGATLVDVHKVFDRDDSLLGADGLHPTARGYRRIANVFFDAVQAAFELSRTSSVRGNP